jgi:hypothetical protein
MTDEERVKAFYPGAEIVGYSHGKVRVEVLSMSIIVGDMISRGTREQRRTQAWKTAADRLPKESE